MNWPIELIIKRDVTNTKVANSDSIVLFIENYDNLGVLENYLKSLEQQKKLEPDELKNIIDVTKNRIEYLNNKINIFLKNKEKEDLTDFYELNIYFIEMIKDEFIKNSNIGSKYMELLIEFLRFCIGREKDSFQNKLKTQNTFDEFYDFYKNKKETLTIDEKYKEILDDIVKARENILNKTDESAMDYSERGYTKVLSNGQNLIVNEEEITKLGSAAFITTVIVLQGTLALSLILSLLALVK